MPAATLVHLGVQLDLTQLAFDAVIVAPKPGRIESLQDMISSILSDEALSAEEWDVLRGHLAFL
eukprot:402969-Amphidinium_carterae.1